MSNKIFKPLNGFLLLEKVEEKKEIKEGKFTTRKTDSISTIPEGKVITADWDELKEGDTVVFSPSGTYEFILNGDVFLLTHKDSIFGKIEE